MKKNNRKGFTIVELVIVIAVIGILAGVLIPTFSSITKNANESAALQQAKSGLQSILPLTGGTLPEGTVFAVNNDDNGDVEYKFIYEGQKLSTTELTEPTPVQQGTNYSGSKYVVYISSESITAEGGLTNEAIEMFNDLFGTNATSFTLDSVASSHYTVTLVAGTEGTPAVGTEGDDNYVPAVPGTAAVKADVYFTSDIKGTMMVVLGNMAG